MNVSRFKPATVLAGAVVLAAFARIYFASRPEIGLDDATSADIVALPFLAMLRFVTWNDPKERK